MIVIVIVSKYCPCMYLTEVLVTADNPYKCTKEAARLRFTMNGTVATAADVIAVVVVVVVVDNSMFD